jgi:hypothetical protein
MRVVSQAFSPVDFLRVGWAFLNCWRAEAHVYETFTPRLGQTYFPWKYMRRGDMFKEGIILQSITRVFALTVDKHGEV